MKFLTLPALLVAALLSALVVVPFLPAAKSQTSLFAVEVPMTSTAPGQVLLYYDTGSGFNESAVTRVNLTKSATPVTYRLPLPPGTYSSFRFDPIDREGTVNISAVRVVGQGGRLIRALAFRDLKPAQHIQSLRERDGRLGIHARLDGEDAPHDLGVAEELAVVEQPFLEPEEGKQASNKTTKAAAPQRN